MSATLLYVGKGHYFLNDLLNPAMVNRTERRDNVEKAIGRYDALADGMPTENEQLAAVDCLRTSVRLIQCVCFRTIWARNM